MASWFKLKPGTKVRVLRNPPGAITNYVGQEAVVYGRTFPPYPILVTVEFYGPITLHFPLNALEVIK